MKFSRLPWAFISMALHFIAVLGVYYIAPSIGYTIYAMLIFAFEIIFGLLIGSLVPAENFGRIIFAACAGAFVAFLPPILATFGLALVRAPYFIINIIFLGLGIFISKKLLKKRHVV